jgi:AraC-like DNA-binding protein
MERLSQRTVVACYREFAPHPALRGRIRAFFSFTSFTPKSKQTTEHRQVTQEALFAAGDPCSAPLFADGNASIVFDLGMAYRADGRWRQAPDGAGGKVIGAMSRAGPHPGAEHPEMVGVYFQPAQVSSFTRVAARDLTDRIVALEDLWGRAALDLPGQLSELDETARIDCLESVLLRQIDDRPRSGVAIDVPRLAAWVLHRRGCLTVERLADAAGVSRQRLTRVFRERVGVSPKLYCRLARFQSALAYVRRGRNVDWARAAAELGYADQSHMIAAFREFSGLTPRRLVAEGWFHPFIERAKTPQPGETYDRCSVAPCQRRWPS